MPARNSASTLDETDLKILQILQRDSKTRINELSARVGRGISSVHARVKSLEKNGVILAYRCIVEPSKVDRATLAFILVRVRYRAPGTDDILSQRDFCRSIAQHPFVQEVHVLSGEFDVLLKVRTSDVQEMNRFIVDFLREIPAVERTLTMFVMETFLETTEIRGLLDEERTSIGK